MFKFLPQRAAVACLLAIGLSASAYAVESPAVGLGQAWPNAPDVSASTHWHVYVFVRDGVRYVQVNDLNGNVRGAFATANGQFLVLPMGRDAERVSTPQQAARNLVHMSHAYSETIYRDRAVQVTAIPLTGGAVALRAVAPPTCGEDPEQCNTHLSSSLAPPTCGEDPEQCNTHLNTLAAPPTCGEDPEQCNTHLTTSSVAPPTCGDDPEQCNTHLTTLAAPLAAPPTCGEDPEQCNTHLTNP
jgi:hypothetical protein